jgi:hypothetical protein
MAALALAGAPPALAQPPAGEAGGATLCDKLHRLEQAALGNFTGMRGRDRDYLFTVPKGPEVNNPLGPKLYGSGLVLPEADDCYIRPSTLRGKNAYYCFWNSNKPEFGAVDYARKISQCFDGVAIRQSDFNADLVVATPANVSFYVGTDHKGDHYRVRLQINGVGR